jgi:hypothetical protein
MALAGPDDRLQEMRGLALLSPTTGLRARPEPLDPCVVGRPWNLHDRRTIPAMPEKKADPKKGKTPRAKAAGRATTRRCGLCGKTSNLTRTECCDQWICDDESKYRMFSFARNSCSRNHRRYTLCGYHSNEGHASDWRECRECRDAFETEMYVYYGTNEHNFVKLENPPSFEPTLCATCSTKLDLGEGGYSQKAGKYYCLSCSGVNFSGL